MIVQGTLTNGTIVLDEPVPLADGTRVEVDVKPAKEQPEKEHESGNKPTLLGLLKLAGTLDDLPPDFAAEHDHYIHGTPKRHTKES
jgi:hypothetical protein